MRKIVILALSMCAAIAGAQVQIAKGVQIGNASGGLTSINAQTGPAVTLQSSDASVLITIPEENVIDFSVPPSQILANSITVPLSGQFYILYPSSYTLITDGTGDGASLADTKSASIAQGPDFSSIWGVTYHYTLPAGISAGAVTTIYASAQTMTTFNAGTYDGNTFQQIANGSCTNGGVDTYALLPGSVASLGTHHPWGLTQVNTLASGWAGSDIDSVTCTFTLTGSAPFIFGASSGMSVVAPVLMFNYTGTPVTQPASLLVAAPLTIVNGTLQLTIPYDSGPESGLADAYVVTIPGFNALTANVSFKFTPLNSNTLTNPTVNMNGLGAVTIKKAGGAALSVGDVVANVGAIVNYVNGGGANNYFELENPQTGGGGSSGITALTGDVTATGPGSAAASVVKVNGGSVPTSKAFTGTDSSGRIVDASTTYGSASQFGIVKVDGTTVTATGGVLSATGGGGGGYSTPHCPAGATCIYETNDTSTGTGNGLLACWDGTHRNALTCPTSNINGTDNEVEIIGIVVYGGGTSGLAEIAVGGGNISWICDDTAIITQNGGGDGYWLQPSGSNAGQCHQPNPGFPPSPNENPEGNTVYAYATTANTGAGTSVQATLLPFGSYRIPFYGTWLNALPITTGGGSNVLSQSHWRQDTSTGTATGIPYALVGQGVGISQVGTSGWYSTLYTDGGASTHDLTINTNGTYAYDHEAMLRIPGSSYNVAAISTTVTGTAEAGASGHYYMGATSGQAVWTLSGDATMYTPEHDNAGHHVSWLINPNGHTWTWPSGFVGMPATLTGSAPILTSFYFDGTNYYCEAGCTGGGGSTSFGSLTSGSNSTAAMTLAPGSSFTAQGGTFFAGGIDTNYAGGAFTFSATDNGKLTVFLASIATAATLPAATTTGFTGGAVFNVSNAGTGTVTITPTSSTINGAATLVLLPGQGASIASNGSNYFAWVSAAAGSGGSPAGSTYATQYNAGGGNFGGAGPGTAGDVWTSNGAGTPPSFQPVGSSTPVPATVSNLAYWFAADRIPSGASNSSTINNLTESYTASKAGPLGGGIGNNIPCQNAYLTSQINGEPAVNFTGTSAAPCWLGTSAFWPGATTIFVVFSANSVSGGQDILSGQNGAFGFRLSSANLDILSNGTADVCTDTTTISAGTWYQANVTYDSGSGACAFRVNETAAYSGTNAVSFSNPTNFIGVQYSNNSEYLNSKVAEIIVYTRVLSSGEIATIEAYLNAKYGI